MVTKKQRRRRLIRDKLERQRLRRIARSRRRRRNSIIVGATLGVVIALVAGFVIVQLVGDDSADGASSSAPARADGDARTFAAALGDRFGDLDRTSTFQVIAPTTGVVGSSARPADPRADNQPTAGSYNRVDRLEASVMIDKPKIAA